MGLSHFVSWTFDEVVQLAMVRLRPIANPSLRWLSTFGANLEVTVSTSELCDRLSLALATHALATRLQSSSNLNNRSVLSETLFRPLLNAFYDWELQSSNVEKATAPAVDLTDEKCRVAVQVTTQKDDLPGKIRDSLTKFEKEKLGLKYDQLYLLSVNKEPSSKTLEMAFPAVIEFKPKKHIISPESLVRKATSLSEGALAPIVETFVRDVGMLYPSVEDNDPIVQANLLVLAFRRGTNPGVDGAFQPLSAFKEGKVRLNKFESSPSVARLRDDPASKAKDFLKQSYVCLDATRNFANTSDEDRTRYFNSALAAWRELEKARSALRKSLG